MSISRLQPEPFWQVLCKSEIYHFLLFFLYRGQKCVEFEVWNGITRFLTRTNPAQHFKNYFYIGIILQSLNVKQLSWVKSSFYFSRKTSYTCGAAYKWEWMRLKIGSYSLSLWGRNISPDIQSTPFVLKDQSITFKRWNVFVLAFACSEEYVLR